MRRGLRHLLRELVRNDTGGESQIVFVVRDDSSHSDILFQTSDSTWQAYNAYGGNSLYQCTVACPPGNPGGVQGAYTVSYNRPFDGTRHRRRARIIVRRVPDDPLPRGATATTSATPPASTSTAAARLLHNHKVFISVGHDEYWSRRAARQRRGGPRRRREPRLLQRQRGLLEDPLGERASTARTTPYRTLVTYKETHADAPIDPLAESGPAPGATRASARRRRRPAGERADRAVFIVNRARRTITGPGAVRQDCGSGGTRPWRP